MIKDPFSTFIELVEFDKGIIETKRKLKKAIEHNSSLNIKLISLQDSLVNAKKQKDSAQKDVHDKELKLSELDVTIKDKKEKLKVIANQKEYTALKKELDTAHKAQLAIESEIVVLWNKAESAKKEFSQKEELISKQIEDLQAEIAASATNTTELESKLNNLQATRPEKEAGVPEEWQIKYRLMHGQVHDPVASISGSSCSACFYHVTNQDIIDLKKRKLIQCRSCYRFLYLKEAFDKPELEQTSD